MRITTTRRFVGTLLFYTAACFVVFSGCVDINDIEDDKRITLIKLKRIVREPGFLNAPNDSIFGLIDNSEVVFASERVRPTFYNDTVNGAYYITRQIKRGVVDQKDPNISAIALRLDGIRDTGTYYLSAPYSVPKTIDPSLPAQHGAQYRRRNENDFDDVYETGTHGTGGEVYVAVIDRSRNVITGTFRFTAYCEETGGVVKVQAGAFRFYVFDQK